MKKLCLSHRLMRFSVDKLGETVVQLEMTLDEIAGTINGADSAEVSSQTSPKKSELPANTFPETCPFSVEELLDDDFFLG